MTTIHFTEVSSSVIEAAARLNCVGESDAQVLVLRLQGGIYAYRVTRALADAFFAAPSKGKFFSSSLKGKVKSGKAAEATVAAVEVALLREAGPMKLVPPMNIPGYEPVTKRRMAAIRKVNPYVGAFAF